MASKWFESQAQGFTLTYVSHEGSCPMTILWHLEDPIPAKFISITSQISAM